MSVVDEQGGYQRDFELARAFGLAYGVNLELVEAHSGRSVDKKSRLFRRLFLGYKWKQGALKE